MTDDDRLTARLREVAGALDAVPPLVDVAARDAFAWRRIDAELAELTYDSEADTEALAGVRGADGPRLLTFEAPPLTVELEVSVVGQRRRLTGQLVPPQSARLEVRHRDGAHDAQADALGRFSAADLPAGPVSIRCHVTVGDQPVAVDTGWASV